MSLQATKLVWAIANVTSAEKLVLLALADFANDANKCWPAIGTLATMCSVKPRQIQRTLASLEAKNIISIERNCGRANTNVYTIKGVIHDTFSETEKGVMDDVKGDTDDTFLETEKVSSRTEKVSSRTIKGVMDDTRSVKNQLQPTTNGSSGGDFAKVFSMYEKAFALMLPPMQAEMLEDLLEDYGLTELSEAITIAAGQRNPKLNYIAGICRRRRNGETSNGYTAQAPVTAPATITVNLGDIL